MQNYEVFSSFYFIEPCGAPRIAAMDTWPLTPLLNELLDEIFPEESDCSVGERLKCMYKRKSSYLIKINYVLHRQS